MLDSAFVLSEHIPEIVTTGLLSMVPTFEGRYALLTGLAMGMPALAAYALAAVMSSIPVPILLMLLKPIMDWVLSWPFKPIRFLAEKFFKKAQEKAAKMKKGSFWALYVFVALPVPGTGVWTGSAIAVILDLKRGPAALVILAGNLTACLITTLIGTGVLSFL